MEKWQEEFRELKIFRADLTSACDCGVEYEKIKEFISSLLAEKEQEISDLKQLLAEERKKVCEEIENEGERWVFKNTGMSYDLGVKDTKEVFQKIIQKVRGE